MNHVGLTGRLTRDPEMRSTKSGEDVCGMRLAVDGPDENTTFVDVTAFGGLAGNCGEYLEKGRAVAVSGRLAYSEWEAEDGSKRSKHEVIAQAVDFLGGRPREEDAAQEAPASA
jgi:single-strand DNA-binding protein